MERKLQPVAVGVGQLDMYMARMTNQQQKQQQSDNNNNKATTATTRKVKCYL